MYSNFFMVKDLCPATESRANRLDRLGFPDSLFHHLLRMAVGAILKFVSSSLNVSPSQTTLTQRFFHGHSVRSVLEPDHPIRIGIDGPNGRFPITLTLHVSATTGGVEERPKQLMFTWFITETVGTPVVEESVQTFEFRRNVGVHGYQAVARMK